MTKNDKEAATGRVFLSQKTNFIVDIIKYVGVFLQKVYEMNLLLIFDI